MSDCIRIDISEDDYHADALPVPTPGPTLSNSIAKILVEQSPAHAYARHPRLGGARKDSDLFDLGKLVHKLLLQRGAPVVVVDKDDWRTKEAQEAKKRARAENKIPALRAMYERALEAADATRTKLASRYGITLSGTSELQVVWQEKSGDDIVWCRGMLDHFEHLGSRGIIYDLKTCATAKPYSCASAIASYGYDIQRAAYTSALEKLYPELRGRIEFVFIFAEKELPFAVSAGRVDDDFRERGEERWREAVDTWARCLRFNDWPEYSGLEGNLDKLLTFECPSWARGGDIEISFGGETE